MTQIMSFGALLIIIRIDEIVLGSFLERMSDSDLFDFELEKIKQEHDYDD
jgi:hypothetical protein